MMFRKVLALVFVLLLAACGAQAPASPEAFPAPEVNVVETATPSYVLCTLPTEFTWERWDGMPMEIDVELEPGDGVEVEVESRSFLIEVVNNNIVVNGEIDGPFEDEKIFLVGLISVSFPDGVTEIYGVMFFRCGDTMFVSWHYRFGGYFIEPSPGGEQA